MINFLKRYWFLWFLGGVVVVLFLIKTFFAPGLAPTPAPLEKLPAPEFVPEQVTNQVLNYQFDFPLPTNFPSSLPVHKISQIETKTFPEIKPDLEGAQIVSSDSAAVEIAKGFLQEKEIDERFASLSQVGYRTVGKLETFLATTSAEADLFIVDFWPKIDGATVVTNKPIAPPTSVWVGKNGKVQKALATIFSLEETKTYPLRSLVIAQQDLFRQKGVLVWLEKEETYGFLPPKTIGEITIERVSLAYFLPLKTFVFFEPIYIFEGKTELENGKVVRVTIYLPAVEENLLSP